MSSIFLSHSHADNGFARRLARDLQREGIKVWIDEAEIKIGDSLLLKIQSGILDMDYLGVILSPNSVNSNWVTQELRMAMNLEISGGGIKVLPILYQPCEIPLFLRDKKYADFTKPKEYRQGLYDLYRTLIPDLPPPVYLTARQAAREAKIRFHPKGALAGISHVGTVSQFYTRNFAPDLYYCDAKTGMSRVWCIEFLDVSSRMVYPFSVDDGEWVEWPEGITYQKMEPIDFNYIDSDVAVAIARRQASAYSSIYDDEDNFFVLTKLRYYEGIGFSWLISFYDPTLSRATYAVRIHPENASVLFAGKEA